MKLKLFAVRSYPFTVDLALLVMRLVAGFAFILHGWGKIQTPFQWMGPEAAVPGVFQALAAVSEFGGGFALMVGLLTRLGSLGLVFTMGVAVLTHRFGMGDPFVASAGGRSYELAAAYLVTSLFLLAAGPGRFALDRLAFGSKL